MKTQIQNLAYDHAYCLNETLNQNLDIYRIAYSQLNFYWIIDHQYHF